MTGPSGSGKSTLLHVLGGLEYPTKGEVFYKDENLYKYSDDQLSILRRRRFGFVFQAYNLVQELNAYENILLPVILDKKKPDKKHIDLLIEMLNIGDRLSHLPSALSGGQQQRIAIARALANKPAILFADEPTGNLDGKTGQEVLSLLKYASRELGVTLILVTHDIGIAEQAERIIKLEDGPYSPRYTGRRIMKKINNIAQLVRSIIKGRRKSYVFLITAIFFAVLFSSFSMLITYGAITSIQNIVYQRYGYQDYIINNANGLPLEELIERQIFSKYGISKTLGYVLPDGENFVNGFSIAKYDEAALSITNKQLTEGRLPEAKGEIAVESTMLDRVGFEGGVGDEITLILAVPDGTGFLADRYEKTYILTGILYDQYIYQMRWRDVSPVYDDIPAAIVSDEEEIEAGGIYITKCYYTYGKRFSPQRIYDINFDSSSEFNGMHDNILISSHDFGMGVQEPALYNLLVNAIVFAILSAALLVAAGFGIASAFSANADERKRQIGMLRAVGATKRQVRSIFAQEIIYMSVIGIPAGVLLACIAVGVAAKAIGGVFVFTLNIPIILLVIVFSLLCIIISASIPLVRASKIPPMQAIRDIELSRKMKKQRIKSRWKYDADRHIAGRSIKLYKNSLAPINIFIFLTVTILLVGAGIGPYILKDIFTNNFSKDFTISINEGYYPDKIVQYSYSAPGISESDRRDAQNIIGGGTVYGDRRLKVNLQLDEISDYILNYSSMRDNGYLSPESPEHEGYLFKKGLL